MALALHTVEPADLSQRTRWYAFVRFLFLAVIAAPSLLSLIIFEGWTPEVLRNLILFTVAIASNLLFYLLIFIRKDAGYQRYLAGIWIGLDVLLVTFLIFTNGGIESRSAILYTMPILIAAAIFGRFATYLTAVMCSLIYAGLIVGDYFGVIHSVGAIDPTLRLRLPYVINSICFFPSILLVIALAVDFITKLLIQKQHEASEGFIALKRAQDIAKLGSWEWDVEKDQIDWSDGLLKIYGFAGRPEYFTYDVYLSFIHPDDAKTHRKIVAAALKKKETFYG